MDRQVEEMKSGKTEKPLSILRLLMQEYEKVKCFHGAINLGSLTVCWVLGECHEARISGPVPYLPCSRA